MEKKLKNWMEASREEKMEKLSAAKQCEGADSNEEGEGVECKKMSADFQSGAAAL